MCRVQLICILREENQTRIWILYFCIEIVWKVLCCIICLSKNNLLRWNWVSFTFLPILHSFIIQTFLVFFIPDSAVNIKSELPFNTLMSMDYQSLQQLATSLTPPQLLNPIDRLYSMQNSYFCGEPGGQPNHHQHHQMCE